MAPNTTIGPGYTHPWLLASPRQIVMSHHGASGQGAPAGSRLAYKAAYELGYRWFQVDVVATRDGLVLMHSVFGRNRRLEGLSTVDALNKHPDSASLEDLLTSTEFAEARWNVEMKSRRGLRFLTAILAHNPDARPRVMVGSPMRPGVLADVQDVFGNDVATAAPVVHGGVFGLRFAKSRRSYHAVQVHRRFMRPSLLAAQVDGTAVQIWTSGSIAQTDKILMSGFHPIAAHCSAAAQQHLASNGRWPSPPLASGETRAPASPHIIVQPNEQALSVDPRTVDTNRYVILLGGGGWRGAFGGIGAVLYFEATQRWQNVELVGSVSGGSFVAASLMEESANDAKPSESLRPLYNRLVQLGGAVRRRFVALVIIVPLAIFPPIALLAFRRLISRFWRQVLVMAFGAENPTARTSISPPVTDGGHTNRRYVICATGRETAKPKYFIAGDQVGFVDQDDIIPGEWSLADAVQAATALPWFNGYRAPNRPPKEGREGQRGEVLIDGGIAGIFGTQLVTSVPGGPSMGLGDVIIIDAGRPSRRSSRVADRLADFSTLALLARWLKVANESLLRNALTEAMRRGSPHRLIRLVADDLDDWTMDIETLWKVQHCRRVISEFGQWGLTKRNAQLTITLSVVLCCVELEPEHTPDLIFERISMVSQLLGLEDTLTALWSDL